MEHVVLVDIAASADAVWRVLADVERWPEWTPTMARVERLDPGRPFRSGSTARVRQPGLRPAVWRVTALEEARAFTWESRAAGVTVVAGHELSRLSGGDAVRVRLTLAMTGALAPAARLLVGRRARRYLATEAASLKAHCERGLRDADGSAGSA